MENQGKFPPLDFHKNHLEHTNFEGFPSNQAFPSDQTSSMMGEFSQQNTNAFENSQITTFSLDNKMNIGEPHLPQASNKL